MAEADPKLLPLAVDPFDDMARRVGDHCRRLVDAPKDDVGAMSAVLYEAVGMVGELALEVRARLAMPAPEKPSRKLSREVAQLRERIDALAAAPVSPPAASAPAIADEVSLPRDVAEALRTLALKGADTLAAEADHIGSPSLRKAARAELARLAAAGLELERRLAASPETSNG